MTGMDSQTVHWPYRNAARRAWCPKEVGPVVMSVPLLPKDAELSRNQFLSRLGDRVQWMLEQEGDPAQVFQQMVAPRANGIVDLRGINLKQPKTLGSQMVEQWEDLLRQHADLNQVTFPQKVSAQAVAVHAMQETNLLEWLTSLLPADR
jgi:hypothetical protein